MPEYAVFVTWCGGPGQGSDRTEFRSTDGGQSDLVAAFASDGIDVIQQYHPESTHDVVAMVCAPDEHAVRASVTEHVDRGVQRADILRTFSYEEIDDVFGES